MGFTHSVCFSCCPVIYTRACCFRFSIDSSEKSSPGTVLVLISYGSVLMLSISIISVMECTPCPLALMAAWVMGPHCIAAKSWLNNLPLLRLERLSQLFNDVSMLEGWGAHWFTHTHTIDRLRRTLLRTDWRGHARGTRQTKGVRHQANSWSDSPGRKHQHATVKTEGIACNMLLGCERRPSQYQD